MPDLAASLEEALAAQGRPASVEVRGQATEGLSQRTWFVTITNDDQRQEEAVLRLPSTASGGRAIRTQQVALRAMTGTAVPAPRPLWWDETDDNAFGAPFLVMERVHGEVPAGWHDLPSARRESLARRAIDVLVDLHAADPEPLLSADAPWTLTADPAGTELAWYRRRIEKVTDEVPPVLAAGLWWLERHRPDPPTAVTVVHRDFRMGNFVVGDGELVGVLDWEMAGVGDPASDLAWCFIPVWQPPGVSDVAALHERYSRRSGRNVAEESLRFHTILGYVRLAYYALSATRAFDAGHGDDLRLAALRFQLPVHLDRLAATMAGEPVA